jgi:hypothetical protein
MISPPGPEVLLQQILAFTKVDVTPKSPTAGQVMTVETVPGILPFQTPALSGVTSPLPVGGPLNLTLNALIQAVEFSVKYKVKINGADANPQPTFEPLTAGSLPNSDPLLAWFQVPPLLVPEHLSHGPATKGELIATIKVKVEGLEETKDIPVPLALVTIPIPCLLVLYGNNKVFLMVRSGSHITDAASAASLASSAISTLNGVRDLLNFGAAFDLLLGDLTDVIGLIAKGGPVGVAVEEALDLDDYNDFDDEAEEMALFAPVGTEVRFYSGEEFNELAAGENEVKQVRLLTDIAADAGVPGVTTGFGFARSSGWQDDVKADKSNAYTTDDEDNLDDVESCRFVNPGDPNSHPGEGGL